MTKVTKHLAFSCKDSQKKWLQKPVIMKDFNERSGKRY